MDDNSQMNAKELEDTTHDASQQSVASNEKPETVSAELTEKKIKGWFTGLLIGMAVLTVLLVVLVVIIQPVMTPQDKLEATALSMTKTVASVDGSYVDPNLLIEPLPVENVSGIAILGGILVLVVLTVVLREFILWQKTKKL